jgi:hypothetical protein
MKTYTVVNSEKTFYDIKNLSFRLQSLASIIQNENITLTELELKQWEEVYVKFYHEIETIPSKVWACMKQSQDKLND